MRRNIFITEKQEKILKNVVKESLSHGSSFDKSTSSLSVILSPNVEEKILNKRYDEVKEIVGKLIGNIHISNEEIANELSKIMVSCKKKERKSISSLENICLNSLYELFNIPDNFVDINCHIVNRIDDSNIKVNIKPNDTDIEFDDSEEMESIEAEIQKRMLLNTLVMGASIVLTKHILKLKRNEISNMDNTLYNDYRKILWLNEYYMFSTDIEVSNNALNQAGGVDVKLGDTSTLTIINSSALCFPILLVETIRGLMELFISHGLPEDKRLAKYILEHADTLKYQQYSIIAGPIIWNRIMNVLKQGDLKTTIIPNLFTTLSEMNVSDFNTLMKEITLNTKKGKELVSQLLNEITNEIEYENFEDRLNRKREELYLINDEKYISVDELLDEDILSGDDEII